MDLEWFDCSDNSYICVVAQLVECWAVKRSARVEVPPITSFIVSIRNEENCNGGGGGVLTEFYVVSSLIGFA